MRKNKITGKRRQQKSILKRTIRKIHGQDTAGMVKQRVQKIEKKEIGRKLKTIEKFLEQGILKRKSYYEIVSKKKTISHAFTNLIAIFKNIIQEDYIRYIQFLVRVI